MEKNREKAWDQNYVTDWKWWTRLHDLQHLLILYPNKRKDEVFGKYYAPPPAETAKDGYIQSEIQLRTPMLNPSRGFGSNPASPAPSIVSIGTPVSPPTWPPMNGLGSDLLHTLNEFTPGEASATGGMYDADLMLDVPSSLQ